MKRRAQPNQAITADRTIRISGFVLLVGVLVFLTLARRKFRGPDHCPIDGHAAQWTRRRDMNACDYGHFSNAEKTQHTWSAACP